MSTIAPNVRTPSQTMFPVFIPADGVELEGDFALPEKARGVVIFAHGSGSSRHSPRNRYVADTLHEHGVGTLLIDLLTATEAASDRETGRYRFDIPQLARRLMAISDWVAHSYGDLKLGFFGASTGAAAALTAAAMQSERIAAVVSRGGRPDLASAFLSRVKAPSLLIVGEKDTMVLAWNRQALQHLNPASQVRLVRGATHLFEEPGALQKVATLAAEWFEQHFASPDAPKSATR